MYSERNNRLEIILNYWYIFNSHLCEFHDLDYSFVETYCYELDWNSISKNRKLNLNIEFLLKYENKFIWHELALNESIIWSVDLIERFKKRLDWYYLGRNENLPLSDHFIHKYHKNLFVVETNRFLTNDLKDKYNLKILPKINLYFNELQEFNVEYLDDLLNSWCFNQNQKSVYDKVIAPLLRSKDLGSIFKEKFDYLQRYFFIKALKFDVFGLTPEFKTSGENPFGQYDPERGLIKIEQELCLVNGASQEGPPRLYDVPRISFFSYYPVLLVSESIKQILSKFSLPNHIFHKIKIKQKKIKTATQFYILQFEYDSLLKSLDYMNSEFYYKINDYSGRIGKPIQIHENITNYEDLLHYREKLNNEYKNSYEYIVVEPTNFDLLNQFDIYTNGNDLILNEFVKAELELSFKDELDFQSAELLKIRIKQDKYQQKVIQDHGNNATYRRVGVIINKDEEYFQSKKERLENQETLAIEFSVDDFYNIERDLQVVFPSRIKQEIREGKIIVKGFNLLPITEFYIQNDFSFRYPESYKSIVIGENGYGDTINLLLRKESDSLLDEAIYKFLHETGEVKKCRKYVDH